MTSSIEFVRELLETKNVFKLGTVAIERGISPVRRFNVRFKMPKFLKLPSDSGMFLESMFSSTLSSMRLLQLPSSRGIFPHNRLKESERGRRSFKPPFRRDAP